MKKIILTLCIIPISVFCVFSQSIINTKHNLSVSGPGTIKATTETEICIFCHTSHKGLPQQPLWNKNLPGTNYIIYTSSTEQAVSGQPDGSSILCLSCHDGTIALGNVISRSEPISFSNGITTLPTGKTNLTTDLSDDHPISFTYDAALAVSDGQLIYPAGITLPVRLEKNKVQCISCHDPHSDVYGNFLVVSNENSGLCNNCHSQKYWSNSTHNSSGSTWNGSGVNPWFHTTYSTVSKNGCENCHNPHNAGGKARLRNYSAEENNCLDCHNGNVAKTNIEAQLNKIFRHNVYNYLNVHDPTEPALVLNMHDECEDCHNPHASNHNTALAPAVKGFNAGVVGINQSGNPVNPAQNEYEICYRCHADSPNKPASTTARQILQNNLRLEFDLANPSFHPVVGPGKNSYVPSLLPPYTVSSIIYCTACHGSDGSGAPAGPHGSIYPSILNQQYVTIDKSPETAGNYALCYSCHNRSIILSNSSSFPLHSLHVQGQNTPCNLCHDPHGISVAQGGNSINNAHLINFNTNSVTASTGKLIIYNAPTYQSQGTGHGTCYLTCHGVNHNPKTY